MSKFDRPLTERATPELLEWVDTVDRNAGQKNVLARAREAHQAVWQTPRTQPLFSSVAGSGAARPEDFSFFFYSAPAGGGATVAEDDATAKRLRRLQMLKLMLQEAQAQAAQNPKKRG